MEEQTKIRLGNAVKTIRRTATKPILNRTLKYIVEQMKYQHDNDIRRMVKIFLTSERGFNGYFEMDRNGSFTAIVTLVSHCRNENVTHSVTARSPYAQSKRIYIASLEGMQRTLRNLFETF